MNRREFAIAGSAIGVVAITSAARALTDNISPAARALYRRATVLDCNLGLPITSDHLPLPQATLDMARNSGITATRISIGSFGASFEDTLTELAVFQRVIEAYPDYFMQVRGAADIAVAKRTNKFGIIFGFEGAACLEDKIDRIALFRNLGVRVMQLSYNLVTPFGAGVMAPPDATLTDLGRQAIAKMNQIGVALDLSHANPPTTAAALTASAKPVVMTHGGCMAVYAHPRNKTDDQLRALAQKGGVFGVFDLPYLAASPHQPNIDDYLAHMTHALDIMGEDHVGIGSDTSLEPMNTPEAQVELRRAEAARHAAGVAAPEEDRLPYVEGLDRPDRALVIADALLKRGYPARIAEKVLGANFARVFSEIW